MSFPFTDKVLEKIKFYCSGKLSVRLNLYLLAFMSLVIVFAGLWLSSVIQSFNHRYTEDKLLQVAKTISTTIPTSWWKQVDAEKNFPSWGIFLEKLLVEYRGKFRINLYQKQDDKEVWKELGGWGAFSQGKLSLKNFSQVLEGESVHYLHNQGQEISVVSVKVSRKSLVVFSVPTNLNYTVQKPSELLGGFLLFLFLGILFSFLFSCLLTENLTPYFDRINQEVTTEAAFSQQIFSANQKAFEELSEGLHEKKHKLGRSLEATEKIRQNASGDFEEILSQITLASDSLEKQSRGFAAMSSSLEVMSSLIKSVSVNASEAVSTSQASEDDAKRGGDVANKIIKHMNKITQTVFKSAKVIEELGKRSDEIVDIINVIDDIADQTELLALNAAIEAARAGPQGRGFAVVADQVRSLAEKTSHATKEIAATLSSIQKETSLAGTAMNDSIREIDIGAGFAVQAGVNLRKIVAGAKRLTERISVIAQSAENLSQNESALAGLVTNISKDIKKASTENNSVVIRSQEIETELENLSKLLANFSQMCADNQLETELVALGQITAQEIVRRSERLEKIQDIEE